MTDPISRLEVVQREIDPLLRLLIASSYSGFAFLLFLFREA
jgi:hypothetical protein